MSDWISVKTRLPTASGLFLVASNREYKSCEYFIVHTMYFQEVTKEFEHPVPSDELSAINIEITHWMKLPEHPKFIKN